MRISAFLDPLTVAGSQSQPSSGLAPFVQATRRERDGHTIFRKQTWTLFVSALCMGTRRRTPV